MPNLFDQDHIKKTIRVLMLLCIDLVLVNLASGLGLFVRFEFSPAAILKSGFLLNWIEYSAIYSVAAIAIFFPMKLYSSLWQFAGVRELMHIVFAVAIIAVLQFVMIFTGLHKLPKSYPVINGMFLVGFLAFSRLAYRLLRTELRGGAGGGGGRRRTMMIGAGSAGAMALREFQTSDHSENQVVCFIDDDPAKKGGYIRNVKIVGGREEIERQVREMNIEEIVFAIPAASSRSRREIFELCKKTDATLKIIPGIFQLANGEVTLQKIRSVDVLDLLGRDSVKVDLSEIAGYLTSKCVLVTGGGGSIGSELCRQIAGFSPAQLVIFDIYENNAYGIQQELVRKHPELNLKVLIGSVRDAERVNEIFREYRPSIVFHAAAHKHVPLMEDSPAEAVKNNVFGTLQVAKAADRYAVKTFVMISTDKAVNPTNVMGATKRICEMIVQSMAQRSQTKFVAVRFGNVLGSNGSVIPLFKEQIEAGGPVTVTHKDIIRYFMTIPEAVSLVLQAGSYAQKGEIFVLDMGEPVRIDDLARNMIKLSGFEPDVDIEIKYTGLRPGEKLFEEMLMDEEGMRNTSNELIHIGKPLEMDEARFWKQLEGLREACEGGGGGVGNGEWGMGNGDGDGNGNGSGSGSGSGNGGNVGGGGSEVRRLVEGIVPTYRRTKEIGVESGKVESRGG